MERFNISQISEIQGLVNKAALSQVADQQLEQYGQDIVNGLKYLLSVDGIQHGKNTYHCLEFNSANEQGYFVAAYHNDIKGKQGVEHIVNDLHTVDAFVWLMIKARSELLLKGYNKDSLPNEFEQCFGSIVSKEIINQLVRQLDIDSSTTSINRFIDTYHATLFDTMHHHLSGHQQHQSTLNVSLSETQVGSSNRSKRSIDIIETNINTYYDNVSSGSSRLQFWPVNLIKKSGEAVLSFLSIGQILPQLELLVKQQLAQMLSNDPGIKLNNNKQQKEELVKSGPIYTEIKKDNTIDTDLNVPRAQSKFKSNQYKSRFEFSKDRQYIVWRDQDNQAYNMASLTSGVVFRSDNSFQIQKHYVGCGRVPEHTKLLRRNATDHSVKNKNIHIIKTHQENLLCLNFHSIEKFYSVNQLPSWVLTCKQPSLIVLAIPTPKSPSYLDITEQNTSLILKGINIHNMVDNGVKVMLPALNTSQRSMITIPMEILIILGASCVTMPNIGFMQYIPSAKNYFDLAKNRLVPSNVIKHYIPEKYTKTAENVVAGSLTLAAIGMTSYSSVLSLAFATHAVYNSTKSLLGRSSNGIFATISLIGSASYCNVASKISEIAHRIIQGMNVLQVMSSLYSIDKIVFSIVKEEVEKDKKILIGKIYELIDDFESFKLTDSDKEEITKIKITLQNTDISTKRLREIYEKLDKIESEYYFDAFDYTSEEFGNNDIGILQSLHKQKYQESSEEIQYTILNHIANQIKNIQNIEDSTLYVQFIKDLNDQYPEILNQLVRNFILYIDDREVVTRLLTMIDKAKKSFSSELNEIEKNIELIHHQDIKQNNSMNIDNDSDDIISAIKANDLAKVRDYLKAGKDVNASSRGGMTLLMRAVDSNCSTELVEFLIEHKADVNVEDNNGETAINIASCNGNLKLITILASKGAIIKDKTKKNSPFNSVAESFQPQDIKDKVINLLTHLSADNTNNSIPTNQKLNKDNYIISNLVEQMSAMNNSNGSVGFSTAGSISVVSQYLSQNSSGYDVVTPL